MLCFPFFGNLQRLNFGSLAKYRLEPALEIVASVFVEKVFKDNGDKQCLDNQDNDE